MALKAFPSPRGKPEGRARRRETRWSVCFISFSCPFCPKTVRMKAGASGHARPPWKQAPPFWNQGVLSQGHPRARLLLLRPGSGSGAGGWGLGAGSDATGSSAILWGRGGGPTGSGITKLRRFVPEHFSPSLLKTFLFPRKLKPCVFGLIA